MAEHILQTNPSKNGIVFRLRYDTYGRWMNSDLILKPGEVAIAAFPNEDPTLPPRAIGMKVGDGTHYFDELPWVQGLAADVYNWAKASDKPTYTANEIQGLAEFVAAHSQGGGSGGSSSGAYRIVWDASSNKYILQIWNESENAWEDTASNIDLNSILTRINNIERWANGATSGLGNIYDPIDTIVYDDLTKYLNKLDVNDLVVPHEFVTSVTQTDGKISITRSIIRASDITDGILSTTYGGTGLSRVEEDEVLVGSSNGDITTRSFVTEIEATDRASFATVGAIIDYVTQMTAGLTGAMHFVGEATIPVPINSRVDPQIYNYTFRNAQMGDVILANDAQELIWTGSEWRLLGDEGSYAIKGSITNADIADNANIAQSKIANLEETFNTKVDKVDGKQLSTNDYSAEDKEKLDNIEDNAQENIIEHIFLNDEEISPSTVQGQSKAVDLHFNGMTPEQGEKLENIEAGAQVNVIEHIQLNGTEVPPNNTKTVNIEIVEYTNEEKEKLSTVEENAQENIIEKIIIDGEEQVPDQDKILNIISNPHTDHINKIESIYINDTEYPPDNQKAVRITLDQAALKLNVVEGAEVPKATGTGKEEVEQIQKKLQLERIAINGDVKELKQTIDTYIILDCGTSTNNVHIQSNT